MLYDRPTTATASSSKRNTTITTTLFSAERTSRLLSSFGILGVGGVVVGLVPVHAVAVVLLVVLVAHSCYN